MKSNPGVMSGEKIVLSGENYRSSNRWKMENRNPVPS